MIRKSKTLYLSLLCIFSTQHATNLSSPIRSHLLLRKCAQLPMIKQHLSILASFDTTFDFSNFRFLEPIFFSLRGSRNRDSTVYGLLTNREVKMAPDNSQALFLSLACSIKIAI